MKRKLNISALFVNAIFALMIGFLLTNLINTNPFVIGAVIYALSTGLQFFTRYVPKGSLMDALNQEIWTDVLVQDFRETEDAAFLADIPDYSRYVTATRNENDIIHLVDVGADPEVITNNITYPIGFATQTDGDIPIQLDTHVTVATRVTLEETQYITYDKIRVVQEKHKNAIMNRKHTKAAHALTPSTNTAKTPILVTTGPDDGAGRKRLIPVDILNLKKKFDDQKIPLSERSLVLSSEHHNDLLFWAISANKSTDHLAADEAGVLKQRLEGFKTFLYIDVPLINVNTLTKPSYGAVAVAGDQQASFAFHSKDMFRASGRTWNFTDPMTTQTHATFYNVRHNYVVLPRKTRGVGAIVSATV